MWRRLARWLRTPPRVRWSWPRDRPSARRAGPARVVALRFIDAWGDDLQLRNEGPGDAADVVVTALLRDAPGAERRLGAALPSLGAGVGYIVTLRPGRESPPAAGTGRRVRVRWRDLDGGAGESWAAAGPGEAQLTALVDPPG